LKTTKPLLLHVDVNKTILLADSASMKGVEDSIREAVAELFWGYLVKREDGARVWEWTNTAPSSEPPKIANSEGDIQTYSQYAKESVTDKDRRKTAVRNFTLVFDSEAKGKMEAMVAAVLKKMQLPTEVQGTEAAQKSGLLGSTFVMLPSFFYLVAALIKEGCMFAIAFRSFGSDHDKIRTEWNSFCERRHPCFSHLIADRGAQDGTTPDSPDRRLKDTHTLYRDEAGPVLLVDTFTNGPSSASWDSWAKTKPKPKEDTRNGRQFIKQELNCKTVDGVESLRTWMAELVQAQGVTAIKDDWAWWQFHQERNDGGKLMMHLEDTQQIFFDDNIERIVDLRCKDNKNVSNVDEDFDRQCVLVNPVEAAVDNHYFIRKVCQCVEATDRQASSQQH
jgi:hypothetical protein